MTDKTQLRQCLDKVVDVFFKPLYIRYVLGVILLLLLLLLSRQVMVSWLMMFKKMNFHSFFAYSVLFSLCPCNLLHANHSFDTYTSPFLVFATFSVFDITYSLKQTENTLFSWPVESLMSCRGQSTASIAQTLPLSTSEVELDCLLPSYLTLSLWLSPTRQTQQFAMTLTIHQKNTLLSLGHTLRSLKG